MTVGVIFKNVLTTMNIYMNKMPCQTLGVPENKSALKKFRVEPLEKRKFIERKG